MIRYIEDIDYNYLKDIENSLRKRYGVSKEDITYFLQGIVYIARMNVMEKGNEYFDNKDDLMQSIIYYYLEDLGIKSYPNNTVTSIDSDVAKHSFVCTSFKIDEEIVNYLIDPTYIQFFKDENCNINRFVYFNDIIIRKPDPGYFVDNNDRDLIDAFNYDGFGELDENLARIYGNSFYLTKPDVNDTDELSGKVFLDRFMQANERLSETKEDLVFKGYYINFNENLK